MFSVAYIRMFGKIFYDKLGMSIKQKISLLIVAFVLVDFGLDRVQMVKCDRGKLAKQHTSFSRVPAVLNQYFSAIRGLYS